MWRDCPKGADLSSAFAGGWIPGAAQFPGDAVPTANGPSQDPRLEAHSQPAVAGLAFIADAIRTNPPKDRQILLRDTLLPVWQHPAIMSETGNQFSLSRAASINRRRVKAQSISCFTCTMLRRWTLFTSMWSAASDHQRTESGRWRSNTELCPQNHDSVILILFPKRGCSEIRFAKREKLGVFANFPKVHLVQSQGHLMRN